MEWTDMAHYQQQIQKITRALLPARASMLTVSEFELLARLYLRPEQNTPILLSQDSGMKKEAVSRCLKALYEKGCVRKQRQESDERSYQLFITETGLTRASCAPSISCGAATGRILRPLCAVRTDLPRTWRKDREHEVL